MVLVVSKFMALRHLFGCMSASTMSCTRILSTYPRPGKQGTTKPGISIFICLVFNRFDPSTNLHLVDLYICKFKPIMSEDGTKRGLEQIRVAESAGPGDGAAQRLKVGKRSASSPSDFPCVTPDPA